MNNSNERKRELRKERRQQGICTSCGKRPAFGRFVECEYCIEKLGVKQYIYYQKNPGKHNAYNKERRKKAEQEGRCTHCLKENPDKRYKTCPTCRAYYRRVKARRYVKKIKPEGICIRCDRVVLPGKKLCEVHYEAACKAIAKGRAKLDLKRHPWKLDEQVRHMKVRKSE